MEGKHPPRAEGALGSWSLLSMNIDITRRAGTWSVMLCYVNYLPGFAQILCSKAENTRLIIQVDNAKLAADDFRIK